MRARSAAGGASKVYVATVARTLKDEAAGGKLQPEFVEGLAAAG